ncbi:NADH:flavin oxidoreductase/NADH oxidase [Trichoderma velutinum]
MDLNIAKPIKLRCGLTLPNRLVKASMSEELADKNHQPDGQQMLALYKGWAQGGWGMVFTGNVHVDATHVVSPHDIAIDESIPREKTLAIWKKWSDACCANGTKAIVQINHPGRQTPFAKGIAPSAIPLDLGTGIIPWLVNTIVFGTPRAMTRMDIDDTIKKFANAAQLASEAGFAGVEIHAAHGYLLAQFLSERCNERMDEYGGSAVARAKVVIDIIKAIRATVPSSFCIGVKLNSADHQPNTDNGEEILEQVGAIIDAGVDFLEISGGTWENPVFNTGIEKAQTKASTLAREAFFIEFASTVRSKYSQVPLMVTGGFRSRDGMEAAIADGSCDLIGMARPSALNPSLPHQILLNPTVPNKKAIASAPKIEASSFSKFLGIKALGVGPEMSWYTKHLAQIGATKSIDN